MPNLANSTLADVLVSEADHALIDVAAKQQVQVSDVIGAAISQYLRGDQAAAGVATAAQGADSGSAAVWPAMSGLASSARRTSMEREGSR
jgi:hypothetical protein